jgi:predicted deacylase
MIPIFPTLDDAQALAAASGGTIVAVPGATSTWAVFPPGRTAADLPAWFPQPTARATDPTTSHDAATRATTRQASDCALVLDVHRQHPEGLTDFELAAHTGRQQTSLGVRRNELRKAGLIRDSGHKRPSPSGTLAIVWTLTDQGRNERQGAA